MKRRELITFLGGAAAWPFAARAEQSDRMRRVGLVLGIAENDPETEARMVAFRAGLGALGWIEGRNIQIEYRFAAGEPSLIRTYVRELVDSKPDMIVANGTPVISELQQATSTIPIVFVVVNDPVSQGFIRSLSRPGGNITGFTFVEFELIGKWLEILKEIAPHTSRAALMFNSDFAPYYHVFLQEFGAAPARLSIDLTASPVRGADDIERTIARLAAETGAGLIVAPEPFTVVNRNLIMQSAARHKLPAVYSYRRFVSEGALVSYGPDSIDIFRRSAAYVDRILKGEKTAELPAQAPIKFELAVNLKTARTLGLDISPMLLARADEVIE